MRRTSFVVHSAVAMAVALWAHQARAEWTVGADVSGLVPVYESDAKVGWIAGLHGGWMIPIGQFRLVPELGGNYGGYTPKDPEHRELIAGYAGARIVYRLSENFWPYGYVHVGFGVANTDNIPDEESGFRSNVTSGAFFDGAVGVSWRLSRVFNVGPEIGYATIEPGKCFCARWGHVGLAAAATF